MNASVSTLIEWTIVNQVADRINSPFFTIDIVQHRDGRDRVVELGDGQVSDLVGWTPQRLAAIIVPIFPPSY
ncbi:ATP-grasp domain-containing protein [Roseofilum sp. Guam]|uniref:ATP-grasp domain-containing protein n=1 Tax=Roseofilum sp. Guam TaxID=2821502 RepID=UPI001B21D1C4|nr:ATP-grasp domain-containing protein [Roseofilum sp. Guam]